MSNGQLSVHNFWGAVQVYGALLKGTMAVPRWQNGTSLAAYWPSVVGVGSSIGDPPGSEFNAQVSL